MLGRDWKSLIEVIDWCQNAPQCADNIIILQALPLKVKQLEKKEKIKQVQKGKEKIKQLKKKEEKIKQVQKGKKNCKLSLLQTITVCIDHYITFLYSTRPQGVVNC